MTESEELDYFNGTEKPSSTIENLYQKQKLIYYSNRNLPYFFIIRVPNTPHPPKKKQTENIAYILNRISHVAYNNEPEGC